MHRRLAPLVASLVILSSCEPAPGARGEEALLVGGIPVLVEAWQTPRDTVDNIDSPAVWHGPAGEHWLLATAKEGDVIVVADASTGAALRRVGGEGRAPGQLDRPNGIAVADDLMFVVERDNARVQVFALPSFTPLGSFGSPELKVPYGIALVRREAGSYDAFITDNYELVEDVVPPDSLLGERVRRYRVTRDGGRIVASLAATFGATDGPGVLRVVESVAVDPTHDRLLVAEEQEGASMLKGYTLDGRFRGEIIPASFFPHQAEGLVLYACGDAGYWIATDQGSDVNTFHVFDRTTLAHLQSFRGRGVLNTDGVALTQVAFPGFAAGSFFAVHDDGNVAAFRWEDVAQPLGLRQDCVEAAAG